MSAKQDRPYTVSKQICLYAEPEMQASQYCWLCFGYFMQSIVKATLSNVDVLAAYSATDFAACICRSSGPTVHCNKLDFTVSSEFLKLKLTLQSMLLHLFPLIISAEELDPIRVTFGSVMLSLTETETFKTSPRAVVKVVCEAISATCTKILNYDQDPPHQEEELTVFNAGAERGSAAIAW